MNTDVKCDVILLFVKLFKYFGYITDICSINIAHILSFFHTHQVSKGLPYINSFVGLISDRKYAN